MEPIAGKKPIGERRHHTSTDNDRDEPAPVHERLPVRKVAWPLHYLHTTGQLPYTMSPMMETPSQ
jgi:hypothetical protein